MITYNEADLDIKFISVNLLGDYVPSTVSVYHEASGNTIRVSKHTTHEENKEEAILILHDLLTPFSDGDSIYTKRGEATFLSSSSKTDAGIAKDADGTFAVYANTTAHTKAGWKYKVVQIVENDIKELEEKVSALKREVGNILDR